MEHDPHEIDWRPIIAALANPHARLIYAQIVLGQAGIDDRVPAAKARNAIASLERAGLVQRVGDRWVDQPETFTRALAGAALTRSQGIERYLDGEGRIDRYPSTTGERRELLDFVAAHVLDVDEVVTERRLTERLARFGPDTAALRRALVDENVVERTRSGSEYARVPQASADPSR